MLEELLALVFGSLIGMDQSTQLEEAAKNTLTPLLLCHCGLHDLPEGELIQHS